MLQLRRLGLVAIAAGMSVIAGTAYADKKAPAAAGAPKYSIEEVMKKVHKPKAKSVFDRILGGTASAEDKALMVEAYESMLLATPPKGDAAAWKAKCQAIVDAAKAVAAGGDAKAVAALKTATNCKSCHDTHRE